MANSQDIPALYMPAEGWCRIAQLALASLKTAFAKEECMVAEKNEIVEFHRQLTENIRRLEEGKPDLLSIQHFALLIARSALRQRNGELTIREELAIVGV
ncbi:MAG: hypothetical protein A3J58_02880 [Candidatus Sungbacteria bacterium RIFCSPHIGHO2_02_FULL_52_23]|uniref:Uncharacterized protein n=1 Tax=Candidatus Sungbacteria bacterium RIFCSPHIGHO2_02_FULL_52_23 TaxID=1802274 RepID=A0A1G2KT92_9BACT|nr:MAG: hypothetical protein A3J58_02880 [Candidatus Sungbacteria bacterium RIFCSPHIGHO2_02_FULL_52_23]